MMLVYFPLGWYVDEVVGIWTNDQRYQYDIHFLTCGTLAVMQGFMRFSQELFLSKWCVF